MSRVACVLLVFFLPLFSLALSGCAMGPRDEIIAGVAIPIPGGMSQAQDQRIELTIPGFGAGQAAYRGSVSPDEIVDFYQREMPARGWRSNASLVTQGGLLAYSKDSRSVLILVGRSESSTTLAVTVGSLDR